MATRDELVAAVSERYGASNRAEKKTNIDEFAASTGDHRKHAMRVLRTGPSAGRSAPRPSRRIYGAAEREALVVLWEASDRVCGKRLKAIIATLIEAMARHGHLALATEVRTRPRSIERCSRSESSAALGAGAPEQSRRSGARSRSGHSRTGAIRLPPGSLVADLVAHSGPVTRGSFVQTHRL